MSTKYVPTISSGLAGPLGVLHLPRLWSKVSLEATGQLADGYPAIGAGYDSMVINALGLNADAVKDYIKGQKPTYPQFEVWVQTFPGVKLDRATIHKLNVAIEGYIHADAERLRILAANGLPDDGSILPDAVNLNNLDDWYEFHQAVIRPAPAVSDTAQPELSLTPESGGDSASADTLGKDDTAPGPVPVVDQTGE